MPFIHLHKGYENVMAASNTTSLVWVPQDSNIDSLFTHASMEREVVGHDER
jgi:hypothetical protein